MSSVFLVYRVYYPPNEQEKKLLGIYSSKERAEEQIREKYYQPEGFCRESEECIIEEHSLNLDILKESVVTNYYPKDQCYAVRCLFKWAKRGEKKKNIYEERITVWKASSFEEAIEKAEEEAKKYIEANNDKYLEEAQVFHIFNDEIKDGGEIFSLLRESNYSPQKYIDTYFNTGFERQGTVE